MIQMTNDEYQKFLTLRSAVSCLLESLSADAPILGEQTQLDLESAEAAIAAFGEF